MRKIISFIKDSLLLILVILACICILQITNNETPSIFGYRVLRVISYSMRPTIGKGDCIIIKHVDVSQLQIGDIITFRSDDSRIRGLYNTHRIYDIDVAKNTNERIFITKGDNNTATDTLTVSGDQIIGKYVKTLLGGRTLNKFIEFILKKWNYFIFILAPLLICSITCVVELIREIHRSIKEIKEVERSDSNEEADQSKNNITI